MAYCPSCGGTDVRDVCCGNKTCKNCGCTADSDLFEQEIQISK